MVNWGHTGFPRSRLGHLVLKCRIPHRSRRGGNQPTNIEIVRSICGILDEKIPDSQYVPHESLIESVRDRPGHDRRYAMDITKIGQELGWEPRQWLESGLEKTIEWYLNNPEWAAAVNDKADYQEWLDINYKKRGNIS